MNLRNHSSANPNTLFACHMRKGMQSFVQRFLTQTTAAAPLLKVFKERPDVNANEFFDLQSSNTSQMQVRNMVMELGHLFPHIR